MAEIKKDILYHEIKDRIVSGKYEPGMRLPKEVDLAIELEVARGTLRPALQRLEEEELLRRVKGKGTFVSGQKQRLYLTVAEVGLVPKRDQSGEVDRQLGITKQGNTFVRRYLIQGANYILGHFGEDCDLKRYGERIAARGGKIAKKKATVAVARKLSGLIYMLWQSDAVYDPNYKQNRRQAKTA